MLKVLICDAVRDENGLDGYEGSIPGNQFKLTGDPKFPDEVRTVEYRAVRDFWWKNRETFVFRCKRDDIANAMGIRMKQLADNPHVGYSQLGRKTVYEQLLADPDPSHIKVNVEGDCSSCVNTVTWVTFRSVNHEETGKIKPLARTVEMPYMYTKVNEFENITDKVDLSTGEGLRRGDILVIPNCHTAMVWNVEEVEDEPERPGICGKATTELSLRTGPGVLHQKCNVQCAPDYRIRNYLYKDEVVKIIGEKNGWYQVEMKGDVYTWTPWCSAKYITLM